LRKQTVTAGERGEMGCGASSAAAPPGVAAAAAATAAAAASVVERRRPGAAGAAEPQPPHVDAMLAQYRFMGTKLGGGVTSRVHLAEDIDSNRLVAIKVVDRMVMKRLGQRLAAQSRVAASSDTDTDAAAGGDELLRREIAVLKKLKHPNIVQLLDVIDDGSKSLYIVLEHMPDCLEGMHLSEEAAAPIVAGLLDALSFCHANYVVHRDIKNANALLAADGTTAKLCDFGFATEWRAQDGAVSKCSFLRAI
jgi:serine/threonine protein kinase